MAWGARGQIDPELGQFLVLLFNNYPVAKEALRRFQSIQPNKFLDLSLSQLGDELLLNQRIYDSLNHNPPSRQLDILMEYAERIISDVRLVLSHTVLAAAERVDQAVSIFTNLFDHSDEHRFALNDAIQIPQVIQAKDLLAEKWGELPTKCSDPINTNWQVFFGPYFDILDEYEGLERVVFESIARLSAVNQRRVDNRRSSANLRFALISAIGAVLAVVVAVLALYLQFFASRQSAPYAAPGKTPTQAVSPKDVSGRKQP